MTAPKGSVDVDRMFETTEEERDRLLAENIALKAEVKALRSFDDGERVALKARAETAESALAALREKWGPVKTMVDSQADDESLWFIAEHPTEERLQKALRYLHEMVDRAALAVRGKEGK